MNKKVLLFISIIAIVIISLVFIFLKKENKFYLTEELYNGTKLIDLTIDDLNKKIENKESFALLVYQPACSASSNFCNVLNEFQQENKVSFYQIPYSNIKDEKEFSFLKFYPSFIIYKNGKVVDFLEANKNEDIDKYTSKEAFKNWFTSYVNLK